jgi:hypothetical protein
MKRQPWVGLVCAGPVSRSGLARIPRLAEQLGWIKSTSIATASRAVNVLRAGRAVRDIESLTKAELIVLHVTDAALDGVLAELASSGLYWPGKSVAIFHQVFDSSALSALERQGASAGCFSILGENPLRFLVEGHPAAVRRIRRLLKTYSTGVIEIERGLKPEYLASVQAATTEFIPLFAAAIEHLRRAGMQKAAAETTAAAMFDSSVKAYLRVGKRLLAGQASRPSRPSD